MQDTVLLFNPESHTSLVAVALYANYHETCGARGIMKARVYPYSKAPLIEATKGFCFVAVSCYQLLSDKFKDEITSHADKIVHIDTATEMCHWLGLAFPYPELVNLVDHTDQWTPKEELDAKMQTFPTFIDLRIFLLSSSSSSSSSSSHFPRAANKKK